MQHSGQHSVSGTPTAVALQAFGDGHRAFVGAEGHGARLVCIALPPHLDDVPQPQRVKGAPWNVSVDVDHIQALNQTCVCASNDGAVALASEGEKGLVVALTQLSSSGRLTCSGRTASGVFFGSDAGELAMLDVEARTSTTTEIACLGGMPLSCCVALDSNNIIVTSRHLVGIVDARTPRDFVSAWRWKQEDPITAAAVVGSIVACGSEQGNAVAFDLRSQELSHHAVVDAGVRVAHVAHIDHTRFVTGSNTGTLRLWSVTGTAIEQQGAFYPLSIVPAFGSVGCLAGFASSDGVLAVADDAGMIDVFSSQ